MAGLILLGLAILAIWSWWPNLPLLFGSGGDEPSASQGSQTSARELEVRIPSRDDATRPNVSAREGEAELPAADAQEVARQAAPSEPSSAEPVGGTPAGDSPAAEPAPSQVVVASATEDPARQINRVRWESGEGFTTLVLEADGVLKAPDASASLLSGDNPRVLLKIKGIERKTTEDKVRVGTPQVATVRIGLHPQREGSEVWVVLDLRARNLELSATKISGNELRLTVRARG